MQGQRGLAWRGADSQAGGLKTHTHSGTAEQHTGKHLTGGDGRVQPSAPEPGPHPGTASVSTPTPPPAAGGAGASEPPAPPTSTLGPEQRGDTEGLQRPAAPPVRQTTIKPLTSDLSGLLLSAARG